jgi:riboflavin kinase / FMN adenylyltransferase
MKIIQGINRIKKFKKPVVALGVFDGVHIGHRRILSAAVRKAKSIGGTSVVLTFEPHPQKEERLYSLEHRLRLIEGLGIDACIVINFNKKFAGISARDFIKNILADKIAARYVFVGKNYRFGKNARGDCGTLEDFSHKYNYGLNVFDVVKVNKQSVSSTYVRTLIKRGKLDAAKKLLMRWVSILGTVIKGASLAKQLGFPTANINPHHEITPPSGIYAVKIIFDKNKYNGICYIGTKPTLFKEVTRPHIEVHIFNFNKKIYGKYLEIQFIKKIRDEKVFPSSFLLAKQVKKDILKVQRLFSRH